MIRAAGLNATILAPVVRASVPATTGPTCSVPGYWLARQIPSMRESATRLGLVTLQQMLAALVQAAETPAIGIRIVEVPEIARGETLARRTDGVRPVTLISEMTATSAAESAPRSQS